MAVALAPPASYPLPPLDAPPPAVPETVRAAFATESNLSAAEAYTRHLTHIHYENFSVVSVLLPRHLRQDFCNIYAFCRTADDLADEIPDPQLSLELLGRFREMTHACYADRADTPVFVALRGTIRRFEIPPQPFLDLIDAFEQDQRVTRYESFAQLVDYCRRSADPVGRLVLYLCGYRDTARQSLSDRTCTALQLANFWQDVRRDLLDRDRIYLPAEDMRRFNVTESQIRQAIAKDCCPQNFRDLMRFQVERTEGFFQEGAALLPMLVSDVRRHVGLFSKGGRAILEAIRRREYDTLTGRPSLSKSQKGRLVLSTLAGTLAAALTGKFRRRLHAGLESR